MSLSRVVTLSALNELFGSQIDYTPSLTVVVRDWLRSAVYTDTAEAVGENMSGKD